ncbi:hypothetical protein SAMN05216582_11143 [Selenomonas ruminantium]|uniref:Uncharacterized protein n=1 Tax=Selenomonas ruminantium TaxID=971 RepID=A0A1M6U8N3_SELRU|nr:hypothetical protein [Selenomonas ruminantium]SHK65625.1 hypothetical protein SAMN05216582_11143 [Selenomonas ruminantium]
MNKRRIVIGGLMGILLAIGGAVMLLNGGVSPAGQQITETTVASRNEDTSKINKLPQPIEEKKVVRQAVKPIQDVFVYSFEGEKVFIVAGSVTVDKKAHKWQVRIKNVNSQGESYGEQVVSFKQDGAQILTKNADGQWRDIDEMDRSLFKKVIDISGAF